MNKQKISWFLGIALPFLICYLLGFLCLIKLLEILPFIIRYVRKIDYFNNIDFMNLDKFAISEIVFLLFVVLFISYTLKALKASFKNPPESETQNEKQGEDAKNRTQNNEKNKDEKDESLFEMLSTKPRKDNYFWQGGFSIFTFFILVCMIWPLRAISVLQLCKTIYRKGSEWIKEKVKKIKKEENTHLLKELLLKLNLSDIDEDSRRPNIPPSFQEVYFLIWAVFLILQVNQIWASRPLTYALDVYFLIESTTWILYYGVFRRFFEEKYSIYHVMEHLTIIFLLIPMQAVSYALVCTYSGASITWREVLPILLGQASEHLIVFSFLGFLYSVIVIGMILNSFPDERIKPGNPDTIIVGAGNVVRERLLKAMIKKMEQVTENNIGKIRIFTRETITFKDNKDWQFDKKISSSHLPPKTESIYSLIRENPKDNIVAWIETPSDTHLYYLRLLLEKADFIAMEKPVVSSKNDLEQLKEIIASESNRKRVFFLSYYILEKALILTFLKRPNNFYLHYLEDKDKNKKDKDSENNIEQFYQAFLELGHIKSIDIELIEKSDNRKLPQGGQLIETLIHHCLIASLFVGLPNTWKIIKLEQTEKQCKNENDNESYINLSACAEHNEKITLRLTKSSHNKEKKQQAVLSFDKGEIHADFDKKEAVITSSYFKKSIKAGVIEQYKEPYAVQCDMVYKCYLNQMDPSNLDGLFYQLEVLEWLLALDQKIKFHHQDLPDSSISTRYW